MSQDQIKSKVHVVIGIILYTFVCHKFNMNSIDNVITILNYHGKFVEPLNQIVLTSISLTIFYIKTPLTITPTHEQNMPPREHSHIHNTAYGPIITQWCQSCFELKPLSPFLILLTTLHYILWTFPITSTTYQYIIIALLVHYFFGPKIACIHHCSIMRSFKSVKMGGQH